MLKTEREKLKAEKLKAEKLKERGGGGERKAER